MRTYITTESRIKDDLLVSKVRVNVTTTAPVESHDRSSPVARHGSSARDIARDRIAGEEPDVDTRRLPLHRVNATAVVVKRIAVGIRGRCGCTAAVVAGVGMAVWRDEIGAGLRAGSVDYWFIRVCMLRYGSINHIQPAYEIHQDP